MSRLPEKTPGESPEICVPSKASEITSDVVGADIPPFTTYATEQDRIDNFLAYAACYPYYGEPDTWGATPSSLTASLEDQSRLIHRMALRFTVPNHLSDIDPAIMRYMESSFLDRFVNRCMANDENYRRALSPIPFSEVDEASNAKHERVRQNVLSGKASVAEILALQAIESIGAIELGSLTHPYGANIEYLDDLRRAVRSSIRLFGGEYFDQPTEVFSISEVINGTPIDTLDPVEYYPLSKAQRLERADEFGGVSGLLMTRKKTMGILPDGTTIRERTSFVLTKESGLLDPAIIAQMMSTPTCDHWGREAVASIEGMDDALSSLLNNDEYRSVVPVSSTIYAFNPERVQEISNVYDAASDESNLVFNGNIMYDKLRNLAASQLREAGQYGMRRPKASVRYVDVNGMAFFGDEPTESTAPITVITE